MTKEQALQEIKALRDKINNECVDSEESRWINNVLDQLDRASDIIEFPKVKK